MRSPWPAPYVNALSTEAIEVGKVVDLEERKARALADHLLPVLRDRGSLLVDAADIEDCERWRRAARIAGRRLGVRVRTGVTGGGERVWAASLDHEVSEAEMRQAGLAMDALLDSRPKD